MRNWTTFLWFYLLTKWAISLNSQPIDSPVLLNHNLSLLLVCYRVQVQSSITQRDPALQRGQPAERGPLSCMSQYITRCHPLQCPPPADITAPLSKALCRDAHVMEESEAPNNFLCLFELLFKVYIRSKVETQI